MYWNLDLSSVLTWDTALATATAVADFTEVAAISSAVTVLTVAAATTILTVAAFAAVLAILLSALSIVLLSAQESCQGGSLGLGYIFFQFLKPSSARILYRQIHCVILSKP